MLTDVPPSRGCLPPVNLRCYIADRNQAVDQGHRLTGSHRSAPGFYPWMLQAWETFSTGSTARNGSLVVDGHLGKASEASISLRPTCVRCRATSPAKEKVHPSLYGGRMHKRNSRESNKQECRTDGGSNAVLCSFRTLHETY